MKKKSFFSIVILYSVLIFINTRYFSTSDDTGFLSAFDSNQWYGFHLINGGRFFPLHGAELHLFRWIFPHDDYWFLTLVYGFSALTFVLCGVILFSFIKKKPISITLLVLFVLLLFSPAITAPFFRMLYAERYIFLLFLCLSYIILKKERNNNWTYIIVIIAIMTTLLKEISAIAMLLFGITLIIKNYQKENRNKYELITGYIVALMSFLYLICYYIFIYSKIPANALYSTADKHIPKLLFFAKAVVEWAIMDPILMILFPVCLIFMVKTILRTRKISNSFVVGSIGVGYIGALFMTNIGYAQHYMTPVYGVALPVLIYYFDRIPKWITLSVVVLQLGNFFPGVNNIVFEHYNNKNLKSAIQYIDSQNISSVFIGGGMDWGRDCNHGISYFFGKKNIQVDIKTFEANNKHIILPDSIMSKIEKEKIIPSFIYRVDTPKKGDVVLITPFTKEEYKKHYKKKGCPLKSFSGPTVCRTVNTKDLIRIVGVKLFPQYVRNTISGVYIPEYVFYKIN